MKKNLLTMFVLLAFSGVAFAENIPSQEAPLEIESYESILHKDCICSESPNSNGPKLLKKDANLVEYHEVFLKRMELKLLYDVDQLLKQETISDDYWLIKQLNVILGDLEANSDIYNQLSDFITNITNIRDDSDNIKEFEAKKKEELPKIKEILISIRANPKQYVRQKCICNDRIRQVVGNCDHSISKLEKNIAKGKLEKVKAVLIDHMKDIQKILSNSSQEMGLLGSALEYVDHTFDDNSNDYTTALLDGVKTLKDVIQTINLELQAEDRLRNIEAKRLLESIVAEYIDLGSRIVTLGKSLGEQS